MDRDHHWISLYTPASDPLHELLVMSGGAWIDERNSPAPRQLVRLLSPEKWVERCYPLWRRRARAARVARPLEIGIHVGGLAYRLTLTRRSSRLEMDLAAPAQVKCERTTFESLLLGNLAINAAIKGGALQVADQQTAFTLATIFSPRIFWQSPLEWMRL
jgi:hypothetical protein